MADENWADSADEEKNLTTQVSGLKLKQDENVSLKEFDRKDERYKKTLAKEESSLLKKVLHDKPLPINQEMQVQLRDPTSPLCSVKVFEELHLKKELLDGIYNMGIARPSKLQEIALPLLLANPPENIIFQSQPGSGKTLAFVLAMLSRCDTSKFYPQCLCLCPTYEIALQTGKTVELVGKFLKNLQVGYAVRGNRVHRGTNVTAQIVIGTPGTTIDWIKNKAFDLRKIEVFVLDEADVMVDTRGFKDQSIRIHRQLSDKCQVLFFSATYDEPVMKFTEHVVRQPNIIRLKETLDNIKQYFVRCSNNEKKYEALINLYGVLSVGQAIFFCHTRKTAFWLATKMKDEKFAAALLTGELDVEQRASVLKRFREAKERALVTTNCCSRGVATEQVNLIVNFDLPVDYHGHPDCTTYLHRIGNTGRFGKSGVAISFVSNDQDMKTLAEIEKHFQMKLECLDTDNYRDMLEKIGED